MVRRHCFIIPVCPLEIFCLRKALREGRAGEAASLALMGLSSGTNKTLEAFDAGATQEQALAAGFWAGAAEVIFEKVSLDHFIKLTGGAEKAALIKNAFKQAGIEASEEFSTSVANFITDNLTLGELSDYNRAVKGYMGQGMSQAEAQTQAGIDALGKRRA